MTDEQQTTPAPPQTLAQKLARPFAVSEHATVKKGGGSQTYAPWTEYVERLNADLGTSGWSFTVVREGFTPTEAWVLGEITATIDGERCVRQQYGCEPISIGQSANGDLLKKAASDAIKKAASLLGIGLYLSIKEEREAMQALMRDAARPIKPGGAETVQQRWQELVAEAERAMLPTIGTVKAIDWLALPKPQLERYCERLRSSLDAVKAGAA